MMQVRVRMNINEHCIETEAKNEFKRLMDSYFCSNSDTDKFEKKIELLREFIDTADFAFLRSSDQRLSGEISSAVILERNNRGKIDIKFD